MKETTSHTGHSSIKRLFLLLLIPMLFACEKYVDIQPKGKLIPNTLDDYRRLLDFVQFLNFTGGIAELGAGDITYSDLDFDNTIYNAFERNTYLWNKEIYTSDDQSLDWNTPYSQIYEMNIILEGLEKVETPKSTLAKTIEGEARFHRARAHFEVLRLFAGLYNETSADSDLGIPLRLKSDVFAVSKRANMRESVRQILEDLEKAYELLPEQSDYVNRASKWAVLALQARIYLYLGDFPQARDKSDAALNIRRTLIDYNDIDPWNWPVFNHDNVEMIFFTTVPFSGYSYSNAFSVSSELYHSYDTDDLRRELFYYAIPGQAGATRYEYANGYGGSWSRFTGLATDEMYLISAEAHARTGDLSKAVERINTLLITRYKTGTYVPYASDDEFEIITKVVAERRKQLIGRNNRWFDLKRLNREPRFATNLQRTVGGTTYMLPAGDARWVFPIPQTVIAATGMPQNQR